MTTSLLEAGKELGTYDGWPSEEGVRRDSPSRGNGEAVRVMVAVDATKDLTMDALEWALINVVQHGDTVTLLGVIPDGDFLCGVNTKALLQMIMVKITSCWRGRFQYQEQQQHQLLEDEVTRKKEMFRNSSMLQHFYKICERRGVQLDVKIVAGRSKFVIVEQSGAMDASWVILDNQFRTGKGYYEHKLLCNVVLMKKSNVGDIVRVSYKY